MSSQVTVAKSGWTPYSCYLVVSPDPTIKNTFLTLNGLQGFFVKFGDGEFRDAYDTHNPSCRGSQNNFQYKESRYLIENKEGTKRSYVQFGKYLEVKLFNIFKDASDTEWHLIAVRPGCVIKRIEHLQQFLVDMLNEFPYCIWNNEGLPMDARTKKFVDNFEKMVYGDKFYQMHHFG